MGFTAVGTNGSQNAYYPDYNMTPQVAFFGSAGLLSRHAGLPCLAQFAQRKIELVWQSEITTQPT